MSRPQTDNSDSSLRGKGVDMLVSRLRRAERLIPEGFAGRSLVTSVQSMQMS